MSENAVASYAARRRRASQLQEGAIQVHLVNLLPFVLPAGTFWTAVENQPRSAAAGSLQKRRGVRSGLADVWVIYQGKTICIELKSPFGMVSRTQRLMREAIVSAGGVWWLARSAPAAITALHLSGVKLRARNGGRFRPPRLPTWEEPVQDPALFKPMHPAAVAARSSARQRQRERVRQQRRALWEAERDAEQIEQELADDGEAAIVPVMDEQVQAKAALAQAEQDRIASERAEREQAERAKAARALERRRAKQQAKERADEQAWEAELNRQIDAYEKQHGRTNRGGGAR
jgi:hypothetical protein